MFFLFYLLHYTLSIISTQSTKTKQSVKTTKARRLSNLDGSQFMLKNNIQKLNVLLEWMKGRKPVKRISQTLCRGETRAKVVGILKKLNSYSFSCQVAVHLDIPDCLGPLSQIFESNMLSLLLKILRQKRNFLFERRMTS